MAAKFLSEEWVQAVKDGLDASAEFKEALKGNSGRVLQVVTSDGDDIMYWIEFTGDGFNMGSGSIDSPTVTVTASYETAAGIAKGDISPMAAFMSGKVDVSNVMAAMGLQGVLGKFGAVVKSIDTEY